MQELTRIVLRVTFCECEEDDERLDSIGGRLVVTVADALPQQLFGRNAGLELVQELTRFILRDIFCGLSNDDERLDSISGRLVVTVADALPPQLSGRS